MLTLRPQCCVVDLRTSADFNSWNLPGSVNIPLKTLDSHTPKPFFNPNILEAQWLELEALLKEQSVLTQLRDQHVLVICYNGDTARVATSVLRAQNIQADSLRGGYQALKDQGLWGEGGAESVGNKSYAQPSVSVTPIPLESN